MAAPVLTTRSIKDSAGTAFTMKFMEETGDGTTGPFYPVHVFSGIEMITKVNVTFSLDTAAYASGDVLADTQVITDAVKFIDGKAILQSLVLIDEDDQGVAMDLHFFAENRSLGTENSAPNISDANALDWLGVVSIGTGDWKDLGGVKVASLGNIGLGVIPASGTKNVYVGIVNGAGAPTFTATGLKGRFFFLPG